MLCAWASISEKGTANGIKGDQTKKEVKIGNYYNFGQNEFLRPRDAKVGKKMAIAAHKLVLLCKKFKAGDAYIGYLTYMKLHPENVVNHTNVDLILKDTKYYCKPLKNTAYNAKYLELISVGENIFHGNFIRKWFLNGINITYKRSVELENLFLKLDLDNTNLNDIKKARTLATYRIQ